MRDEQHTDKRVSTASAGDLWMHRTLLVLAAIPLLTAIALMLVPASAITDWAERLGHADDVTPERVGRLRMIGLILAACSTALLAALLSFQAGTVQFIGRLRAELRSIGMPGSGWSHGTKTGWFHWLTLAVIAGVALAIRLSYLYIPMDYDESYSFLNFARRPLYEAIADYNTTNNHLLNTLCMNVGYRGFGASEWALRWHVFFTGLAAVAAVYILTRHVAGPECGLIATALAATSHVMVNYSVNARGYILTACLATVLIVAAWRIAHARGALAIDWIAAWYAAVLGLFALPTMVYPIAGCVAWLAAARRDVRPGSAVRHSVCWLFLVALATLWLYAPALIYQGLEAWRHPFVRPLRLGTWFAQAPVAWLVAVRSWSEGPLPWPVVASAACLGMPGLWWMNRRGFWLIVSVFSAAIGLMLLQRVAPPPRILSFLAPLFCVMAAAGTVAILQFAAVTERKTDRERTARSVAILAAWISISICVWGYFDARKQPLPGGLRPAFLIENINSQLAGLLRPDSATPTQLWRLDVPEAVDRVRYEARPNDRIHVALPADMPFRFYAYRAGWNATIGGTPRPNERLVLVIRAQDRPESAIRTNLTLRADMPGGSDRQWRRIAAGELAIWLAEPLAPTTTESSDP